MGNLTEFITNKRFKRCIYETVYDGHCMQTRIILLIIYLLKLHVSQIARISIDIKIESASEQKINKEEEAAVYSKKSCKITLRVMHWVEPK